MNSPGFNGSPEPGVGSSPVALDHRLRQTVAVAKMIVSVIKRWDGLKVEHREDLDAGTAGDKLLVFKDAPVVFRVISREENDDRVQIGPLKAAHPMLRCVRTRVAEHLRPRRPCPA